MLNTLVNRKNTQVTCATYVSVIVQLGKTAQYLRISVTIGKYFVETVFAWCLQFILCYFFTNVVQIVGCFFS